MIELGGGGGGEKVVVVFQSLVIVFISPRDCATSFLHYLLP